MQPRNSKYRNATHAALEAEADRILAAHPIAEDIDLEYIPGPCSVGGIYRPSDTPCQIARTVGVKPCASCGGTMSKYAVVLCRACYRARARQRLADKLRERGEWQRMKSNLYIYLDEKTEPLIKYNPSDLVRR